MQAYIARICTSFIDVPDKISVAIYFSGCSIRCPGCQNKELWEKRNGIQMGLDEVVEKVESHPLAQAVVFLGGEPTDQAGFLSVLCQRVTSKEKVLYTGREFEQLPTQLTDHLDLIVCGPYRAELHVGGWPASSNQRVFKKEGNKWLRHLNTSTATHRNSENYTSKQIQ